LEHVIKLLTVAVLVEVIRRAYSRSIGKGVTQAAQRVR
jgi:hypothetical protein